MHVDQRHLCVPKCNGITNVPVVIVKLCLCKLVGFHYINPIPWIDLYAKLYECPYNFNTGKHKYTYTFFRILRKYIDKGFLLAAIKNKHCARIAREEKLSYTAKL